MTDMAIPHRVEHFADKHAEETSSTHSHSSDAVDPMDMTPTTAPSAHEMDHDSIAPDQIPPSHQHHHAPPPPPQPSASAATQQPKVVQTAFIHKLYSMLEDPTIRHLISWSSSNESFVMNPSNDFSKVLSQYFKHTNISSFVRQLNMYGFHKVSDVFHSASPDSTLWEFKHGNGNFRRGDVQGLKEIKRRASRHTLIHRDSFSTAPKMPPSAPGTPGEVIPEGDPRMAGLEHTVYELAQRLARSEENYAILSSKYHTLSEGLMRSYTWNHDLTNFITAIVPDADHPVHRDVKDLQKEITRQTDLLRSVEEVPDGMLTGRQPFFSNLSLDNAPLSPRQLPIDDRRPSLGHHRASPFRPPVPSYMTMPQRRYGSVGNANTSPQASRTQYPPPPPQPPQQHPLASVASPPPTNLPRRHTSADIRQPNWPPQHPQSQWPPSSPSQGPHDQSSQQVREVLAQYELNSHRPSVSSRQTTPPLTSDTNTSVTSAESSWSFANSKFPGKFTDTTGPPTRRSSMASNVHSLLNPAETAEREEEEIMTEDRKRRRVGI